MRRSTMFFALALAAVANARPLQPGFNGNEFRKMLSISSHQSDTAAWKKMWMPYPISYELVYRSPVTALDNRWDLWTSRDSVDVISIRGTVGSTSSWLENFYAGMIPAMGTLDLGKGNKFVYKIAEDSSALVHIGWMIALGSMAPDIVAQIQKEYAKGVKDYLIIGHSQGGAIGFLLTSYLYYEKGKSIPADIRIKTYGSGMPKPGNQYYAYDFDFITRNGWAFRVVNTADWVPEVPFALQALDDLNPGNPFEDMGRLMKGAPWIAKWYARHLVKKMNRSAKRTRKKFSKYLARKTGEQVRNRFEGFPKQKYARSLNYVACGAPIILPPDSDYSKFYPDDPTNIYRHHGFGPYLYLLNAHYPVR